MQLLLSAFAISVAALTLVLAARRLLTVGSRLVLSRWFWVGGVIGFSVDPTAGTPNPEYRVRFEVGGPGVFHNVAIHVLGLASADGRDGPISPERATMNAGDDPIEWAFSVLDAEAASTAWVVVTWVRPFFEGVESEAVARWLERDDVYEWRWYGEANRLVRIGIRTWARRHPRRSTQKMRDLAVFGRWRITQISSGIELMGPVNKPLPKTRPRWPV